MDFDSLEKVFDAWSDIIEKARKAKGLENWEKLAHVSEKLQGKQAKDITFTSSHPSYEGKPVKHTLGSVIGNLHFMLGYVNPAFHLAPYHWQIIDPHLEDKDVNNREHPAKPELWAKSGLPMLDEGDIADGKPHPSVSGAKTYENRKKAIKEESIPVISGYGYYICVPSQGVVFSARNGHLYKWDIVKDSYFAASNPLIAEKMNNVPEEEDIAEEAPVSKSIPIELVAQTELAKFDNSVYPFVRTRFPTPGSIVPMAKSLFGVITPNAIEFYDGEGSAVSVKVFDRVYKSFDLTADGNIHPSILLNFAEKYLKIDKSVIESNLAETTEAIHKSSVVRGLPTPGYEDVPAQYNEVERTVLISGNTFISVPRAFT